MIQRKQSLWLLIAALLNAGVFYFDLYKYDAGAPKPLLDKQVMVSSAMHLRVADHFPSLLIALVMTLLPLVTIFLFKNRKRQIGISFISMIAIIAFMALTLKRVSDLGALAPPPVNASYGAGAVLPVAALVFLFLAILGIRKDNKLVKSMDRLRD